MTIRLQYGEMTCVADTAAEAAEFALAYEAKKASGVPGPGSPDQSSHVEPKSGRPSRRQYVFRSSPSAPGEWDEATVARYLKPLIGYSHKFIAVLVERQSVESADMGLSIGAPPNVLGPVVRTLTTQAERLGMPAPFNTRTEAKGKKVYSMPAPFRDVAKALIDEKKRAA